MLNASGNVKQALEKFANVNPQMRMVMNLCSGRDPKQVFIQECQARGIDPNQAVNRLGLQ